MLYKPNYCCQCGDEIERIDWKLWTSRRFCESCEGDFRQADWMPRIASLVMIAGGVFGLGSYLKAPEKPLNLTTHQFGTSPAINARNLKTETSTIGSKTTDSVANQTDPSKITDTKSQTTALNSAPRSTKTLVQPNQPNEPVEPVYFCGAQTKKKTPCTRKVKGEGRCWQHLGLPAMLPKEKLVVSQ